jgi:hypothetical protein
VSPYPPFLGDDQCEKRGKRLEWGPKEDFVLSPDNDRDRYRTYGARYENRIKLLKVKMGRKNTIHTPPHKQQNAIRVAEDKVQYEVRHVRSWNEDYADVTVAELEDLSDSTVKEIYHFSHRQWKGDSVAECIASLATLIRLTQALAADNRDSTGSSPSTISMVDSLNL